MQYNHTDCDIRKSQTAYHEVSPLVYPLAGIPRGRKSLFMVEREKNEEFSPFLLLIVVSSSNSSPSDFESLYQKEENTIRNNV